MARLTKEYLNLIEGSGVSGNVQGSKKSVSSTIEGGTNVPQENQTAVVYDIISEGPIEGLVDGTNSIFLDKTPVTIGDTKHQPIKIKNATFTASNSTLVDSDSSNPFSNLSVADGKRFIRIHKGKKSITGNGSSTGISGSEGSTIITASSSFFEAQDVSDINPLTGTDTPIDTDTPKPFIRIEGAGTNTNVPMVAPIIRFISATSVEIGHPLLRDISYKTASIDKIGTISSFTNANTAVIADLGAVGTAKINASNVEVEVFTPSIDRENTVYNYQGFQYAFMHGQRNQPYLKGFKDIGSAAIIENKNQAVEQTRDLFSSNNNTTIGAWNTTVSDATAQPVIVTDNAVANPEEVDNVKLTFKFPQMIASKSSSGDEKPGNCELRIWLGFKKTGDSAFTEKLMFGPTQGELDGRGTNKKTRPWESPHNSGKVRTLTKAPFAESFVIDLTPFKPFSEYQIKIQRVDPSQGRHRDYDHVSPCTLDTVEHRFTDKLAYPNSAFATMLFDAESFAKIPSRSYEVKGLKVKVPTNYFPRGEEGRAYGEYDRNPSSGADSGSYQNWDGNFRGDISTFAKGHVNHELVWTDNPAWVFYDLVTNKRYGVGKYIDEAQIDKFELYKIARYCDELVADGKGGTEPRFTANVYIKESADALKVLKDITQIFRGMLYWLDGQIQFSQNRYQLPVYTFSKGNVTGGFSYTSPRGEFRSNQIRVTWNDPQSMYKQAVEIVEDTNNILETAKVVSKDVVAFGATSRGQAHRFGKWSLFTEILESEAVAFQSSINAGFLKPGDVILIQDADRDVISNSGRISNFNPENGLTLDKTMGSGGAAVNINGNGNEPTYVTSEYSKKLVWAGEVNLPSSFSADACLWEHGGTGVGSWLGARSISGTYNLELRSGDGAPNTETKADAIVSRIPISDIPEFDDQVHTVCWEIDPTVAPSTQRLWIDGKLYIDDETTSSNLETSKWTGGNPGGWLKGQSTAAANNAITAWPVTAGSSGLRHYFDELVSSTDYGNSTTKVNLDRAVNLSSGNTFKLSVMYPQGGAYLSNISATINDNTVNASATNNYQRGDLVTHAKVNGTVVKITTDAQARNAVDSSGNPLDLEWNANSRVETQTISTTGASVSALTVSSAFTSAPNADFMWAIREYDAAGDIVNGSAQQYVISEIKEDTNKLYTISALKYDSSKFDLVDRGYILDVGVDTNKLPSFTETPPAPETLTLDVLKSFGSGLNDESNISGTTNKIRINWGRVLNSDGTQYQHLSHFEIKHNIDSLKGNKFKKLTAPKDENYLSVDFDGPKTMIVQIQSVNINGGKSQIVQRKLEVTNDQIVNSGTQILKIPNDGKIDKHIQCSTSTVSIDSKNYQLQSSDGTIYTNPSNGNAASYQQNFSGMANNSEAYLLFDASESATSGDVLKAVEIKKDSTAQIPTGTSTSIPLDFEYMAEVGASSSGITQLTANSQTISGSIGDNIITGSSTAFTTDFANGDTIVVAPAGATRFYSKISYIENDGKLQIVDGLPRDYSSVTVSKLSFKPDPISDLILAKVSYDGSTYTLEEKYSEGTESLGYFHHENTSNTNALSVAAFKTQFGRFPQEGDILIVVNTALSPKASKSYKFSNNAFSEIANFMTGDLIVDGTIEGDKIRSDTQIIAGADDSNKQAVLDGTGTGDNALRIYAGSNVANKASAPFRVTQAGALTATSATIGGAIDATTLNVINASVVGSLTASELTAGSVTVQSLNQAVWNEIDTRVAGTAANGFYDSKDSTTGYLGVSKTLSLTGSSSAGYQHNGEDLHLRFQLVDSFGPTPASFTGDGLKVTAQFQYRLASSSTWANAGSSLTQSLTRTDYSSGALYDIDMDHDVEISGSLTTNSYYHFQVVLTPTITNNAFVAFINYGSGGANDSSGSPFLIAAQQGSTSVGSGSGTVTSVGSGDGLTGGAITGSGTLAVDSTVVRTSGTQTIAGDKTFSNDIIVTGNLDVRGTTTTLDTATLNVEDNNITLNYGTGNTTTTANGAGITIQDAVDGSNDATILWDATNDEFDFSHKVTAPALTIDNISINAEEIASTSNMTLNSGNDIILDADGGNVMLKDNSVWFGNFNHNGNNLAIDAKIQDGDIKFRGNDGGSTITALTLDMSDAGTASFNHDIHMVDNAYLRMGAGGDLIAFSDGTNALINANNGSLTLDVSGNINLDADGGFIILKDGGTTFGALGLSSGNFLIKPDAVDQDIVFSGNDGGSAITALTLDMSDSGKALFNAGANFGNSIDVTGTTVTDGLTVNSGGTSSFLSIRNGSNNSFTKLYSDLNGVTVLDVDANNVGSAPRFQIDVSEVQAFRITEGNNIYFYENTGSTTKLFWDASTQFLNFIDSRVIHNNTTFNTFDWQNYQENGGKLLWTVTGTSGAEMELSSDGSAYGNAVLSVGGQQVITSGKAQTLTNKTLTSPVLNTGVSGTAIKDEDNMASNSATHLATQQSIKAYVDSQTASAGTITGVTNFADNRLLTASGSTTINGESALTFSGTTLTISADVDFNGANADALWDTSEDTLKFNNNAKAVFGTDNDLRIYHNGTTSNANIENHTGGLYITNYADDQDILFRSDNGSGGVTEYFMLDGSQSQSRFLKDAKWNDNIKAKFGTDEDLQIYHDTSNSLVRNFTGALYIQNDQDDGNIIFRSDNGSGGIAEYIVINGGNGSTMLKHYGSTKLVTTATGVEITGNLDSPQISINDYISHNGDSNTYFGFDSADTFSLVTGGTSAITADANTAYLRYQGSSKLFTTNGGVTVTGALTIGTNDLITEESGQLKIQSGQGVVINIDNNDSGPDLFRITKGSTGNNILQISTADNNATFTGKIYGQDTNSTTVPTFSFTGHTDSGMSLYNDGSSDYVNIISDGGRRGYFNTAGITSMANVYTAATSAFRNYAGTWAGTTGTAGNGFYFLNNSGGNTVKAMELSAGGNASFSGTLGTAGNITATSNSNAGTWLTLTNTNQSSSKEYTLISNASGNFYIYDDTANITRLAITSSGAVGVGTGGTDPKMALQVEELGIDTRTSTVSSTQTFSVHDFLVSDFRSARYTIQIKNTTDSTYHVTEILLIHDGTDVYMTEYGTIFTGSAAEATFDADISVGVVRLRVTPASSDNMTFKAVCHGITT